VVEVVESGRQICQYTVEVETPVTLVTNCTEVLTIIVMGDATGPLTVTPTLVEFPPQPATKTARSITAAPSPHTFMRFPPTIFTQFFPCAGPSARRSPPLHQNVRLTVNRNVVFGSNKAGGIVCEDRVAAKKFWRSGTICVSKTPNCFKLSRSVGGK
jgi:hypothetical protein